jgi:5'-methylthioadenosine phosphorylase
MRIGIIGGTGLYELVAEGGHREVVQTPYGEVPVSLFTHAGREVVFLARHGEGHKIPPHRVNYRANIDALRRMECGRIIATNAVGSMRLAMRPGDLVLPNQFIDFTRSRPSTFYDGGEAGVRHVDVSEPYCPNLRGRFLATFGERAAHTEATYVCTEGPRFETPAEIQMFERLGGDVVGMTGVPEVVLAREAGLCYLSICIVTNYAAGIKGVPLTEGEVSALMEERLPQLREDILRLVAALDEQWHCACSNPPQAWDHAE